MIIDMHVHTKSSLDSPATAEDYCKAIKRFKKYHPFDGIVLTEHRVYNEEEDEEYQKLSEKYNVLILKGIEVDTDFGHMLLYGVTRKFLKKMDISSRRLETKKLVPMIMDYGGIAVPAHPFRESSFGGVLEAKREEIKKVTVIEEFNGVNAKEENKRASLLVSGNGLHGIGGSDAHFANRHWFLTCATKFKNPIKNNEDLVRELKNGAFRPISLDNSVLGEF